MLSSCFFMVHDAGAGREDDVPELTRWQQLDYPFLEVSKGNVVAGRDDASLVETTVELDDDLPVPVVIDFLKFTNVAFDCSQ